MARNEISIRQWTINFKKGKYDSDRVEVQRNAGWYDWFCKDSSLTNKTKILGKKLIQLVYSPKIDIDNNYVFFKNNFPMNGLLYDDFRIVDMKTGDVLYTIAPKVGHSEFFGHSEVWGKENKFEKPLVQGMWKDVIDFFYPY